MDRQPMVINATLQDEDELAEMIADAFAELAPSLYLVPDESERRAVLARTFRLDLQEVRTSTGIVRTIPGREAAALWTYHYGGPEPEPVLDELLEQAAGKAAGRFAAFHTALDTRRRALLGDRPHWHLQVLAVRPDRQGLGYGGLLLRDQLARIDGIGEPTYLAAATEELRELYTHFGFLPYGDPIVLADGTTRMFPTLHEPTAL